MSNQPNYDITYRTVKDSMAAHVHPKLWEMALDYLKKTGDGDGFVVMLRGA